MTKDAKGNTLYIKKPYGISELVKDVIVLEPPIYKGSDGRRYYWLDKEFKKVFIEK